MEPLESKINRLEVEFASLKEKVTFFNVVYEKLDATLEKLQMLMEDRRSEMNEDIKDVYQKIQETETKIMSEIHQLRKDMLDQHIIERKKVESLDRWRWIVMGGAAVIGFLISKAADLIK